MSIALTEEELARAREYLKREHAWSDSCFMDDEDYLYGQSVTLMLALYARQEREAAEKGELDALKERDEAQELADKLEERKRKRIGISEKVEELRRWDCFVNREVLPPGMSPRKNGKWVQYLDVKELADRIRKGEL